MDSDGEMHWPGCVADEQSGSWSLGACEMLQVHGDGDAHFLSQTMYIYPGWKEDQGFLSCCSTGYTCSAAPQLFKVPGVGT